MYRLSDEILIYNYQTSSDERARFISPPPQDALVRISEGWWQSTGQWTSSPEEEPDFRWPWLPIALAGAEPMEEFVAIETPSDGDIQGAVLYSLDAESVLEPNLGAISVEYIATAPWNRRRLVSAPRYRGVGTGLLLRAVSHSYHLGLDGRVHLQPIEDEDVVGFYRGLGFVDTGRRYGGLRIFEMPATIAKQWLAHERVI